MMITGERPLAYGSLGLAEEPLTGLWLKCSSKLVDYADAVCDPLKDSNDRRGRYYSILSR
jgi:hypothetical protein